MLASILERLMADSPWNPAIRPDPTPWLTALAAHQYPIFPAVETVLRRYGGWMFNTAPWHDQCLALTDGLQGIFEWSTDQIAIHIDPHAAKALTEAAIWQTHPYVRHNRLQIAPIGKLIFPVQNEGSLFIVSTGHILQGQWVFNPADWKLPSVPVLKMLGMNLADAVNEIVHRGLLIMTHEEDDPPDAPA